MMKVLVAYDGSDPSKKALDKGIEMASNLGAELVLLTVTEPVCPLGVTEQDCAQMYDILKRQSEEILKHIQGELVQRQVKARTLVRTGSPAETIVEVGEKEGVDMIVIGSHGRHGAKRFFLGSVSSRVASHTNVSVVLVK